MRILLSRLRLIGDVVFTTPLLHGLRQRFPDADLTYLVEPAAAPVVVHNPHLTSVVVVPYRRGVARLADDLTIAARLRRARFDVAIDLHGGPRSAWLTWASRAPMRIGYAIAGRTWMYTHVVPRSPDLTPRHSVANQWDLLSPLGIEPCDPSRDPVEMREDPAAAARLVDRLRDAGIDDRHSLVVVHVSAGNPFRRWPASSFQELVVALGRRDPRRRIVLTSGPSDARAAHEIADTTRTELGALADVVPDVGDLDLAELRALIARADVYIGGDSGPVHIASTTTTPIVELLGPTLPERSRPWRDDRWYSEVVDAGPLACRPCHQRTCVPGDFRCLTMITPAQVTEAAERAIAHRRSTRGGREAPATELTA
jgi:lipopolysaccharide heptosyltransferase II